MAPWQPMLLIGLCVFHSSVEGNSAFFEKIPHLPSVATGSQVLSSPESSSLFHDGLKCGGRCSKVESCTTFCYTDHQCSGYQLNIPSNKVGSFPAQKDTNFTACYTKPSKKLSPIMNSFNLTGNEPLELIEKMFDNDCSADGIYHSNITDIWFQLAFPEPQLVSRVYLVHDSGHNHFTDASHIKLHQQVTSPPGAGTSFSLADGDQSGSTMSIYELNPPRTGMAVSLASKTSSLFSGCELWIE